MTRQAPDPCPECGAECKEWYQHKEVFLCGTVLHKSGDDGDELERSQVCHNNVNTRCLQRYHKIKQAVRNVYNQRGDDHCWMDYVDFFNDVRAILDLPPMERTVGSKADMLVNCQRFINDVCVEGGGWRSYAELEAENKRLKEEVGLLRAEAGCTCRQSMHFEAAGHHSDCPLKATEG